MNNNTDYKFSYEVDATRHEIWESPEIVTPEENVPLEIFSHGSTMQVLSRYLVDKQERSFTETARLLGRSPKSTWTSYHQTDRLPTIDESTLRVPTSIFTQGLAPLEALVVFLREQGFRNVDISQQLGLSPKTTHTAWKRAEVKR